jgi:hypothetical protein
MTTIQSIREALSTLDQTAILCDLHDSEFVTGGAITEACRVAGYDESGRVTVNNLSAWNMTVAEFGEHIAPVDTITIHNALFDSRIADDKKLFAAAANGSDWVKGLFAGQPISRLTEARKLDLAERIEQGIQQVGAALGQNWSECYHNAVWSQVR